MLLHIAGCFALDTFLVNFLMTVYFMGFKEARLILLLLFGSFWGSRKQNPFVHVCHLYFLLLAEGFGNIHLSSLDTFFKIQFLKSKYCLFLSL